MSAPTPASADGAWRALLQPPQLHGLARWQAWAVDRIKRAALHHLHASAAGERLLLRMYLAGEEATELTLQRELIPSPPEWLSRQMAQHLTEEQGHAHRFAEALRARGADGASGMAPDRLSRQKIAAWHRLALKHAPEFEQGVLVPAFVIGLAAEQMASRVLQRHVDTIAPTHPMASLLSDVLADETKHIRLCMHTLERLVQPHEWPHLAHLLAVVRRIDRAWGVSGALAMWLAGVALRLAPARTPVSA
ncbi:MAG: hypothetical protein RLZZ618_202 [Pseudomonadota bacterium]|jgi:hypothetical protein